MVMCLDSVPAQVTIRARRPGAPASDEDIAFTVLVRIDTAQEATYYRHGGILPFVYRTLLQHDGVAG